MVKGTSKYLGKIYDGRWEVIKCERYDNSCCSKFVLRNIYNNNEMTLKDETLRKIDRGETTVSKILAKRIRKGKAIPRKWN